MKNLLITTIGDYNHSGTWKNGDCEYDIVLIDYRVTSTFKYPGIYKHLKDNPDLLDYDYFWMPDEDVLLFPCHINELFGKMAQLNLDLAQPSIEKSKESFPSWDIFTHRAGLDVVYSNFIEITCPCFSKKGLMACIESFPKSKSGWGLDLVWPKLIGNNGDNMAIINCIIAKHTRRVRGGELYGKLRELRILSSVERKKLMREYGIASIDIKTHDNCTHSQPARQGR